jgi:probable O-glycosylation ligase (exosortase A-associated)
MRDLVFIAFLAAIFGAGLRRPFIFVLGYVYIDNVAPQRLTYFLLNAVPISQIFAGLAIGAWLLIDDKRNSRVAPRQFLLLLLLVYCGITTAQADFPDSAWEKWDWVWKALAFAIFLPLTLRTKLRIESLTLFMVLSAASIVIVGGIKTLGSGGGYGSLNLMVTNNTGLYESSIISCVAIAMIPLIRYLMKYGTIFPPDRRVMLFGYALIFACLLMPIGTEARTGLVCVALLAVLALRFTKRRMLYLTSMAVVGLAAIPLMPSSFTERMGSIKEYKGDASASTRIEVWKWTWDYVKDHPMGGGFDAYRSNEIRYNTVVKEVNGAQVEYKRVLIVDRARAYHSAYFEMLGEQGYFGLLLWLVIHFGGIWRMEVLFRRYRDRDADDGLWIGWLAQALQQSHLVYLVGSLFVGIAFQPFVYMLVGMQIGLDTYAKRRAAEAAWRPLGTNRLAAA